MGQSKQAVKAINMCGRFAYILPDEAMATLFKGINAIYQPPRYNIAPTQPLVIVRNQGTRTMAQLMRWGLVPEWVKDPNDFPLIINARTETLAEKASFRDSLKHRRCIIPASGYYEWHRPSNGPKQPYYFQNADGSPMCFAGLYTNWHGPNGEEIDTVAVITTPANAHVSTVHHRMPALLGGAAMDDWLATSSVLGRHAIKLLKPLRESDVVFHPVSLQVNNARIDEPNLLNEVTLNDAAQDVATKKPVPKYDEPEVAEKPDDQMDLF